MTEHPTEHPSEPGREWDEPTAEDVARSRPDPTGVARVDAVNDAVSGLDDRPLEEHLAVFEQAHDELRRTLDDPSAPA